MTKRNEWMTLDEIADYLDVSKRTIRRRVNDGKIVRVTGPKRPLYKVADYAYPSIDEEDVDLKPFRDEALKLKASTYSKNAITSFISRVQNLTELYPPSSESLDLNLNLDYSTLCLAIGDTHIGKRTKEYNLDVAKQSILSIPDKILSLDVPQYNEIVVMLIGDMIDGEDIYSTQAHAIQVPAIQQLNYAAEWLYMMLIQLVEYTGVPVRVETCPGNHGRTSKTANTKTNWDNVLFNMLHLSQHFAQTPGLTINVNHNEFKTFEVKDKVGLLNHYGTKHTGTPAMLIKNAGWLHTKKFDFLVHGHYHKLEFGSLYGRLIVANGSLVGQDDLAEKLGVYDPPRQAWFIVTPGKEIHHMGFISFDHSNFS